MFIPVRCFSCNKLVGHNCDFFEEEKKKNKNPEEILNELGYTRICCRRQILSAYDKTKTNSNISNNAEGVQ